MTRPVFGYKMEFSAEQYAEMGKHPELMDHAIESAERHLKNSAPVDETTIVSSWHEVAAHEATDDMGTFEVPHHHILLVEGREKTT